MTKRFYTSLLKERERVAQRLDALDRLIALEGEQLPKPYTLTTGEQREEILSGIKKLLNESGNRAIHPTQLVSQLLGLGIAVPGKNPSSTVTAFLSRNKEFTRAGSAGYYLTNEVVTTESEVA